MSAETWEGTAPAHLRCTHPGCRYYAAGTYRGRKLCGQHLPDMPVLCPTCDGAGEYVPTGAYTGNPHDPGTVPCPTCEGNGRLTPGQYAAFLSYC